MSITFTPLRVSTGGPFTLSYTHINQSFLSSDNFTLFIAGNPIKTIIGSNGNTIVFENVNLSTTTPNTYAIQIVGSDGYNQIPSQQIALIDSETILFSPTTLSKDEITDFSWTDTGTIFLNNIAFTLLINEIPISTVNGSNKDTLSFPNINLENFDGLQRLEKYNIEISGTTYNVYAGEQINLSCFVKGTKILVNDEFKNIEDLKIGEYVKTLGGGQKKIKYIHYRKYKNNINDINQIYQMGDIFLTGGHSILVDEITPELEKNMKQYTGKINQIHGKYLVFASLLPISEKMANDREYELYHIVLENENPNGQYGIFLENFISETMSIFWYENFCIKNFAKII